MPAAFFPNFEHVHALNVCWSATASSAWGSRDCLCSVRRCIKSPTSRASISRTCTGLPLKSCVLEEWGLGSYDHRQSLQERCHSVQSVRLVPNCRSQAALLLQPYCGVPLYLVLQWHPYSNCSAVITQPRATRTLFHFSAKLVCKILELILGTPWERPDCVAFRISSFSVLIWSFQVKYGRHWRVDWAWKRIVFRAWPHRI